MKKQTVIGVSIALALFCFQASSVRAVASTTWTKNASAVLSNNQAGYPRVVKDGSTYKLWVEENGAGAIRYATSTDGITWSALQATNLTGDTGLAAHEFSIIKDGSTYKMWFNDITITPMTQYSYTPKIGYRTSADGLTWSDKTDVTITTGGQAWDVDYICPTVIKDGSTYKMYYNANEGNGKYYIAYATSSDGTTWSEPQNLGQVTSAAGNTNNNLVLKQGDSGTWDGYQSGEALYQTSVLKNSAGTYEMFYGGNKSGESAGANGFKIGYATSPDGVAWTKSTDNPVLSSTLGAVDANGVYYPSVVEDVVSADGIKAAALGTYQMWYWIFNSSWNGNVGYATASTVTTKSPTATVTTATAPTVTVSTPVNNETTAALNYTVRGTVSDSSATVKLLLNDVDQGTITVGSDGSFSKVVVLRTGSNEVKASATNSAGTSGVVSRTVSYAALASTGASVWLAVILATLFVSGLGLTLIRKRA